MIRQYTRFCLAALLTAGILSADVTYNQTTKFKGGSLVDMMQKLASTPLLGKMMGGNMKQAFEDQHYDIYLKGNKMARLGGLISTIYDLDASTVTTLDNSKHTYSVMTFEEMSQQIEQMQQRANRGKKEDMQFDVKVEKTGETRTIDGETAHETLMTLTAKQAGAQGQMVVKSHAWLVPVKPAMQELQEFQRRLGQKFAYAYSSLAPSLGVAASGLSSAAKELYNQDGYPVLSETEITGVTAAGPMGPMGGSNSDPNAPLIRLEMTSGNFVVGAVDDSKFSIPAGYKEEKKKRM